MPSKDERLTPAQIEAQQKEQGMLDLWTKHTKSYDEYQA